MSLTPQGRVFRVNDRSGQKFRGQIGSTTFQGGSQLDGQWIDERYTSDPGLGFVPTGDLEEIALVAPKSTDVLRVRPSTVPAGLRLSPTGSDSAIRGGFYSAAFLLRETVADLIDIEPDEIDLANIGQVTAGAHRVGELVFSDHLPNGAGFVRWAHDNWHNVMRSLTAPSDPESFGGELVSDEHRAMCATAGYDCLFNYRNMAYHGLLDWRLGIAVLRALHSNSYRCGLDGDFSLPELTSWEENADRLGNEFASVFELDREKFGQLPGFQIAGRPVVVVHPLWGRGGPAPTSGLLKDAIAYAGPGALMIDTFNLQRRQTWCYQRLVSQASQPST